MIVQILIDNKNSWIIPFALELEKILIDKFKYKVYIKHDSDEIKKGDVLILLGCEKKFTKLNYNKHNLVVHESDLPNGKGWSPLTWQILEEKNRIPITLFEANKEIDSGDVYFKDFIDLDGSELNTEIKRKQGEKTIILIIKFFENYSKIKSYKQKGKSTFYSRRNKIHSELDIDKSINEQFNLLRVCDNERYPAFFWKNSKKYILKIYEEKK